MRGTGERNKDFCLFFLTLEKINKKNWKPEESDTCCAVDELPGG